MRERFSGGKPLTRDATGKWSADVRDKTVADAGKRSAYFTGDSKMPKAYQAGEFAKQQWYGGKTYTTEAYQGTPDATGLRSTAREQGGKARGAGTAAAIPGPYHTAAAREASGAQIDKPLNAATEIRRGKYPEPQVQGWEQQRRMDIKTVNNILGR